MATQRSPEEYKRAYEHHKSQGNAEAAARVANLYRQYQATQPKAKDGAFEGYGDAFMRGIDQPLENMGVTAEALGAEGLGKSLKGAIDERPGQSASAQFMNADKDGSFAWRYLPKAGVEQAGQFAGSIASRAGGAALGGAVGNVPGAIAGGFAGPALFEFVQQLGPIALERAKNNGRDKPNAEDWTYATGTSVGVGAMNAIAPGASGTAKRMLIEGATEGGQSVVEQVGSTALTKKGLEVDPRQAAAEGIIGGTSAGMVDTSVSTAKAATNLVRGNSKNIKNEGDTAAAASLAGRLNTIATANSYDLKDIDKMSTKGARETIDKAHVQYTEELKQKFADLKSRVKITDQDTLAEVSDKIMTAAAYREGRNKTKNTVGKQEMAALEKLTGDTREGQEAMSILRQLNQLTEVHNNGYQGGVSQVTDQFAPFGAASGYDKGAVATERLLRPLVSGSAAISTGGGSLLAQLAAQGTGRAIDKVTGKRSKVATYVKKNSGNQGIPGSNATSLRETNIENMEAATAEEESSRLRQEQYTEEERQANLRRVQQGAPPQQGSPEDIMRDATGLDRSGLAQVIRILKANPNTLPATIRAIEAYETSVATGGLIDFGLYRDINALVDQYPQLKKLMVRPRNAQAAAQGQAQQQLSQKEQNYQRGINDNRAEADRITEAVNQDKTIRVQHKAILVNTLVEMRKDLGINPVDRLQTMQKRLEEQGVPSETVEKYLGQYLQRVMEQQGAKAERDAAQDDVMEIDESREPSLVGETIALRKARAEEQGFDTSTVYYHGTASEFSGFSKDKLGDGTQSRSAKQAFFFSDSPRTAQSYAHNTAVRLPVLKLLRDADKAESKGDYAKYDSLLEDAEALENRLDKDRRNGQNIIPVYLPNDDSLRILNMKGRSFDDFGVSDEISEELKSAKYDGLKGVKFLNLNDSAGLAEDPSTHVAIFEPSNIRSVNAQFDPSLTESPDLVASQLPGSGALTQPESPQIPFDFTTPTVGQIKDKLEDAKGAVQMVIGKPGTKFEKGLSSYEDYKQLADMLNVSIGIYDSQKEFMKDYAVSEGTRGLYGADKGGASGMVRVLKQDSLSGFIQTLSHEISHSLESRPETNEPAGLLFDRTIAGRHDKAEDVKRTVYQGSMRAKLRGKYGREPLIKAEINKLQDGTIVSIANRPDLPGRPIRLNIDQTYDMFRENNPQGSQVQAFLDVETAFPAYQGYMKGDGEFAVDPVMFYLINPKAMKKDMPNTFKFMQKHFNESNIPIKIYASPLATIMAILMAGIIGGEEEEEENPGILTPGPGMLTA
jgi:hypothetical protein